jgi:hypothetical protein
MRISTLHDPVARISSERLLGLLCLLYAACALTIAPIHYGIFLFQDAVEMSVAVPLMGLLAFCFLGAVEKPLSPILGIRAVLAERFPSVALVTLCVLLGLAAFTTFKFRIPDTVPFYADNWLADIDERIHGVVPWEFLHRHSPTWVAAVVEFAYIKLWFAEWFGMLMFAAASAKGSARTHYLWAFAMTMFLVGTVLATLLSSVGPILYDHFYPGERFAGLVPALKASPHNEHVLHYSAYLLASYNSGQPHFGTGISAMPSMHVAIAVLNAWYLCRLNRWLGVLGWIFAGIIFFGSVYTGWHYAIDGYVSLLVVTSIWWICQYALRRSGEAAA